MVGRKTPRPTRTAEGGSNPSPETEVKAAPEGSKAGDFGPGSGRVDRPIEGGEAADSSLLGEGPAENSGSTDEGNEDTVLLGVEGEVARVLTRLSLGDGVWLEGPPRGGVAGPPVERVVDGDVGDDRRAVGPKELDVSMPVLVGVLRAKLVVST